MDFHPLTTERWNDLETLFGERGACGGCWCMWWRITRAQFEKMKGDGNRRALRELVAAGSPTGVLAYDGGEPVGWCSVAPRENFASIERSHVLERLDEQPVWSLPCLFIAPSHRDRGLTLELVRAAVEWVRGRGGKIVEAYPTDPRGRRLQAVSSFMGVPSLFEQAGFMECARPSEARVVMRRYLQADV